MLRYVIKSSSVHAQRDTSRWGSPDNTLPWLFPGPSQEPSAHHWSISTSPDMQRGTSTVRNPNEMDTLSRVPTLSRAVPGEPPAPASRCETQEEPRGGSSLDCLLDWEGHCLGVWDTIWDIGEEHYMHVRSIYICLRVCNTFSALLVVGPGDMELPHLYQPDGLVSRYQLATSV